MAEVLCCVPETILALCRLYAHIKYKVKKKKNKSSVLHPSPFPLQASRLIVTFGRHVISNNFKLESFIKLGAGVSPPCLPSAMYLGPQTQPWRALTWGLKLRNPGAARGHVSGCEWGMAPQLDDLCPLCACSPCQTSEEELFSTNEERPRRGVPPSFWKGQKVRAAGL